MKKFLTVFLAIWVVQGVLSKSVTTEEPKTALSELLHKLNSLQSLVVNSVPSLEDVSKTVIGASKDLAVTIDKTTKEMKPHQITTAIEKEISQRVTNFVGSARRLIAIEQDLSQRVKEYVGSKVPDTARSMLSTIGEQADDIYKQTQHVRKKVQSNLQDARDNLEEVMELFYKYILSAGQRLKTDVEGALKGKSKQ